MVAGFKQPQTKETEMGVTPKVYTKEEVKTMSEHELNAAVPQILKAFNEDRNNIALWEIYHEAALKIVASRTTAGSQSEWRQKLFDGITVDAADTAPVTPTPPPAPAAPAAPTLAVV